MDEAVLHRPIGDEAILVEQLDRLLNDAKLPNVEMRVVPMRRSSRTIVIPSFTLVQFGDGSRTAYVEDRDGGRFEEGERLGTFDELASRLLASSLEPNESMDLIASAREIAAESATEQAR
jgi:hypothetical protein